MQKKILLAAMAILAVLLPLSGCAEKQEQVQEQADEADAPPDAPPDVPSDIQDDAQDKPPEPAEPNVEAAEPAAVGPDAVVEEVPVHFGEVLVAWNTGEKRQAIEQFLRVRWDDPAVFGGIPVLAMSEQQFVSLPPPQRDQVSQQAQEVSEILRDLARGLFATAEDLAASGDAAAARTYLETVQQFGQALAAPERLDVIQALGQAVTEVAQEKQADTPQ